MSEYAVIGFRPARATRFGNVVEAESAAEAEAYVRDGFPDVVICGVVVYNNDPDHPKYLEGLCLDNEREHIPELVNATYPCFT